MKNNINLDIQTKVLENGLTLICYKKPTASKFYAIYTTKYGSLNDTFKYGENDFEAYPKGIAHFLEHKMFEKEDGDTFVKFAKFGGNANAFTSFNQTSYLFGCTQNFYDNLTLLVDMVNLPWFTKETTDKEKGIIEQEIRMYDDNPDWRGYFGTLQNMYQEAYLKDDIAGTVDSIYEIKAEHLYECYNAFYSPNNMCLVVSGNLDIDEVEKHLLSIDSFMDRENVTFTTKFPVEPEAIAKKEDSLEMDVNSLKYNYGLKLDHIFDEEDYKKTALYIQMFFSAAMSNTSPIIDKYVKAHVIENNFGYYFDAGSDYAYLMFSGNVLNETKMDEFLNEIFNYKMTPEQFETEIKKHIGSTVFSLESMSSVSNDIARQWVLGNDYLEGLNLLYHLNFEDYEKYSSKYVTQDFLTNFIVKPFAK